MNVELPEAPAAAAGLTREGPRLRLAFSLHREGRLSPRPCAELAGLTRERCMDEPARPRGEAPFTVADLAALDRLERQ